MLIFPKQAISMSIQQRRRLNILELKGAYLELMDPTASIARTIFLITPSLKGELKVYSLIKEFKEKFFEKI